MEENGVCGGVAVPLPALVSHFLQGPRRVPVPLWDSLWWAQGEIFSQELLGDPSPGKRSQMNGSFFVQGNTRFPCQGIFLFLEKRRKGERGTVQSLF